MPAETGTLTDTAETLESGSAIAPDGEAPSGPAADLATETTVEDAAQAEASENEAEAGTHEPTPSSEKKNEEESPEQS